MCGVEVEAGLAFGGNHPDTRQAFDEALRLLEGPCQHLGRSSLYRTRPWGGVAQEDFLNAVVRVRTSLDAPALMRLLQQVEGACGKEVLCVNGPRRLDLDLLYWGGEVVRQAGLVVPHPRMGARDFVLLPLQEVAPGWRHPLEGWTAGERLAQLEERFFTGVREAW